MTSLAMLLSLILEIIRTVHSWIDSDDHNTLIIDTLKRNIRYNLRLTAVF